MGLNVGTERSEGSNARPAQVVRHVNKDSLSNKLKSESAENIGGYQLRSTSLKLHMANRTPLASNSPECSHIEIRKRIERLVQRPRARSAATAGTGFGKGILHASLSHSFRQLSQFLHGRWSFPSCSRSRWLECHECLHATATTIRKEKSLVKRTVRLNFRTLVHASTKAFSLLDKAKSAFALKLTSSKILCIKMSRRQDE